MKTLNLEKMEKIQGGIDYYGLACAGMFLVSIAGTSGVERQIIVELWSETTCATYL